MTALVPAIPTRAAGANLAAAGLTAATASDTFPAGDDVYLRVKSTNAGTIAVTVTPPTGGGPAGSGTTVAPYALLPVVEATTGDRLYGPFPANPFADQAGNVTVACSPFASVNLQVIKTA